MGGQATRLRPLTWRTPKAMVPVLNRPFFEHALTYLKQHGASEVIVALGSTGPGAEICEAFGDGERFGLRLSYSIESEALGSGGAFKLVEPMISGDTFVVLNGDIFTDLDLGAMLDAHRRQAAVCTISLTEVEDPSGFGVVALEDDDRIQRFVEKPPREQAPSRWINAGIWIFEPSVLEMIPPGRFVMVEKDLFPALAEQGAPIYGYRSPAFWVDIGTPERYLNLNLDLLDRTTPLAQRVRTGEGTSIDPTTEIRGRLYAGANCRIDAASVIRGRVVIGDGCVIGEGAIVEDSLLWDDVRIGAGAYVRGSVLASGVAVSDGCGADATVAAHGARVEASGLPPGARLEPDSCWPS